MLFDVAPQQKPDLIAEYFAAQDESEDFKSKVQRMLKIGKILNEHWQAHPLYGHGDVEEKISNPMVRLEIHHNPGPRSGTTVSVSFVRLSEFSGEMSAITKRLRNMADWHISMMPVKPDDPVFGVLGNVNVSGDHMVRIPRMWDFPNKTGLNFAARKRFKERFPQLRPVLAEALHRRRKSNTAPNDSNVTLATNRLGLLMSKRETFFKSVSENPGWTVLLDEANVSATDVWSVASNEFLPADVDRLGQQQDLFAS